MSVHQRSAKKGIFSDGEEGGPAGITGGDGESARRTRWTMKVEHGSMEGQELGRQRFVGLNSPAEGREAG